MRDFHCSDNDEMVFPERFSTRRFRRPKHILPDRCFTNLDRQQLNQSYFVGSYPTPVAPNLGLTEGAPNRTRKVHVKDRSPPILHNTQSQPELAFAGKRDVRLVVGNGDSIINLQVSSEKLGPVYRHMCRENRPEHSRRYTNLLALPRDDPAAMEVMCGILHGDDRQDKIVDIELIHRVAVLCKKYQAHHALSDKLTTWLKRYCQNEKPDSLKDSLILLSAAHLTGNDTSKAESWVLHDCMDNDVFNFMNYRRNQLPLPDSLIDSFAQIGGTDLISQFQDVLAKLYQTACSGNTYIPEENEESLSRKNWDKRMQYLTKMFRNYWPAPRLHPGDCSHSFSSHFEMPSFNSR